LCRSKRLNYEGDRYSTILASSAWLGRSEDEQESEYSTPTVCDNEEGAKKHNRIGIGKEEKIGTQGRLSCRLGSQIANKTEA
jgi:hypothetical protein